MARPSTALKAEPQIQRTPSNGNISDSSSADDRVKSPKNQRRSSRPKSIVSNAKESFSKALKRTSLLIHGKDVDPVMFEFRVEAPAEEGTTPFNAERDSSTDASRYTINTSKDLSDTHSIHKAPSNDSLKSTVSAITTPQPAFRRPHSKSDAGARSNAQNNWQKAFKRTSALLQAVDAMKAPESNDGVSSQPATSSTTADPLLQMMLNNLSKKLPTNNDANIARVLSNENMSKGLFGGSKITAVLSNSALAEKIDGPQSPNLEKRILSNDNMAKSSGVMSPGRRKSISTALSNGSLAQKGMMSPTAKRATHAAHEDKNSDPLMQAMLDNLSKKLPEVKSNDQLSAPQRLPSKRLSVSMLFSNSNISNMLSNSNLLSNHNISPDRPRVLSDELEQEKKNGKTRKNIANAISTAFSHSSQDGPRSAPAGNTQTHDLPDVVLAERPEPRTSKVAKRASIVRPRQNRDIRVKDIQKKREIRVKVHLAHFIRINVQVLNESIAFPLVADTRNTIEYLAQQIEAEFAYRNMVESKANGKILCPLECSMLYDEDMTILDYDTPIKGTLFMNSVVKVKNDYTGAGTFLYLNYRQLISIESLIQKTHGAMGSLRRHQNHENPDAEFVPDLFYAMLAFNPYLPSFIDFSISHYILEHTLFYMEVEFFQTVTDEKIKILAAIWIYKLFLATNAPLKVNVLDEIKLDVTENYMSPKRIMEGDLFDEAQDYVCSYLKATFDKFKQAQINTNPDWLKETTKDVKVMFNENEQDIYDQVDTSEEEMQTLLNFLESGREFASETAKTLFKESLYEKILKRYTKHDFALAGYAEREETARKTVHKKRLERRQKLAAFFGSQSDLNPIQEQAKKVRFQSQFEDATIGEFLDARLRNAEETFEKKKKVKKLQGILGGELFKDPKFSSGNLLDSDIDSHTDIESRANSRDLLKGDDSDGKLQRTGSDIKRSYSEFELYSRKVAARKEANAGSKREQREMKKIKRLQKYLGDDETRKATEERPKNAETLLQNEEGEIAAGLKNTYIKRADKLGKLLGAMPPMDYVADTAINPRTLATHRDSVAGISHPLSSTAKPPPSKDLMIKKINMLTQRLSMVRDTLENSLESPSAQPEYGDEGKHTRRRRIGKLTKFFGAEAHDTVNEAVLVEKLEKEIEEGLTSLAALRNDLTNFKYELKEEE